MDSYDKNLQLVRKIANNNIEMEEILNTLSALKTANHPLYKLCINIPSIYRDLVFYKYNLFLFFDISMSKININTSDLFDLIDIFHLQLFIPIDTCHEITCSICLEKTSSSIVKLHCNHHFHQSCITKWLDTSIYKNCPYCRNSLIETTLVTWYKNQIKSIGNLSFYQKLKHNYFTRKLKVTPE